MTVPMWRRVEKVNTAKHSISDIRFALSPYVSYVPKNFQLAKGVGFTRLLLMCPNSSSVIMPPSALDHLSKWGLY